MSKLWGGRFGKDTSELVDEFGASLSFDQRLWEYDIRGSIAHARMLGAVGIIPEEDARAIVAGLESLAEDIRAGKANFEISAEDVHMNIERLLRQRIGEPAGKLHTGRSRNDQVALDIRMYLKDRISELLEAVQALQRAFIAKAEDHLDTIMPGFTHLQHAQPVPLAHHLLAYFWMLQRDAERLCDCYTRTDVMPLGSGALAGTSFPLDRESVARELGFSRITENSVDAVSDRDFVVEFLSAGAILGMHLSRFCEEVVLWNTREFGFIELDDSIATGSSLMPQKKNPDVAELIRGKAGRLYGNLLSVLTMLKGQPLAYNKDLQEDKEPLFDTVDTLLTCLRVACALIGGIQFRVEVMSSALKGDFSTATDIADHLVRRGMPFREAHNVVGRLVAYCIANGKTLEDLAPDELASFSEELAVVEDLANPSASVEARDIPGSTSAGQIRRQIEAARKALSETRL